VAVSSSRPSQPRPGGARKPQSFKTPSHIFNRSTCVSPTAQSTSSGAS
jgi:hypothetical protein